MKNRERTIGVLAPLVRGYYFGTVLAGITEVTSAAGYRVVAIQTSDPRRENAEGFHPSVGVEYPGSDYIDGYLTILNAISDGDLERLVADGKPVVTISHRVPHLPIGQVGPDNGEGIGRAVAHLVQHGHTRIAFVGSRIQTDQRERGDAYRAALLSHGITPDPSLFFDPESETIGGGYEAGEAMIASGLRSTAVIAATDWTAYGVMDALAAHGVDVPREQAVIGFDDGEASEFTSPPLTSVRADFADVGRHGARLLLAQLGGAPVVPGAHLGRTSLTVRESCGCPPAPLPTSAIVASERREQFHQRTYYQGALLTQYAVSQSLLGVDAVDPTDMGWLAHTNASAGVLGLREPDGSLLIAGSYSSQAVEPVGAADEDDAVAAAGTSSGLHNVALGHFPTAGVMSRVDPSGRDIVFILPLIGTNREWGWLGVVAPVEARELAGRETVNQWAVVLAVALDVSAKGATIAELTGELAAMMENSPDAIARYDCERRYRYLNGPAARLLGVAPADVLGRTDDELRREETVATRWRAGLEDVVASMRTSEVEFSETVGDDQLWFQARMVPLLGSDGALNGILTSSRDITALKRAEQELAHRAVHDSLTGLPNRVLFVDRVQQAIARLERRSGKLAVMFIDLDHFKEINDSLGHDVGDRLLVNVARRIEAASRRADTLARFGGDEFVLLCDRLTHQEDVRIVAGRIGRALAEPFIDGDNELNITASIGIAVVTDPFSDPTTVIRNADEAMYSAKSSGRNRSHVFDGVLRDRANERQGLEADLRHALERGELRLAYQPLFALDSGAIQGVEALIRWTHPTRGNVPPSDFIPLAEQRGLIWEIGAWVLDEALRQLAEWHAAPGLEALNMAVNLSARQLADPVIAEIVAAGLAEHGIAGEHLTLEITETALIEDGGHVRDTLAALSALGVRLALDDFGTGYSSLVHLRDFPVDTLKIDRSFVEQLGEGEQAREIIGALTAMAHFLKMTVVGEGIERQYEWDELLRIGCDEGQGFLVSRALAPASLASIPGWPRGSTPPARAAALREGSGESGYVYARPLCQEAKVGPKV